MKYKSQNKSIEIPKHTGILETEYATFNSRELTNFLHYNSKYTGPAEGLEDDSNLQPFGKSEISLF